MTACTGHIVIADVGCVFIFRATVLSFHEIIGGFDILSKNKTVLDYMNGQIFFQDFATFDEESPYDSRKLRVVSDGVPRSNSVSFVVLFVKLGASP